MNSILLTGSNGFIGSNLKDLLISDNILYPSTREDLDVSKQENLFDFLRNRAFDTIIHTAISGTGKTSDVCEYYFDNTKMIQNLLYFKGYYSKLFLFNSAASFDRNLNIENRKEGEFYSVPKDLYGNYKYLERDLTKNNNKVINLNIFNCFGKNELSFRFISTCINNCLGNKDIVIEKDRYFSFFYVKDLYILIDHLIKNDQKEYLELNCCYDTKTSLSDVAKLIKSLTNSKSNILLKEEINEGTLHYHGCGKKLESLYGNYLKFIGLKDGIMEIILEIKNEK